MSTFETQEITAIDVGDDEEEMTEEEFKYLESSRKWRQYMKSTESAEVTRRWYPTRPDDTLFVSHYPVAPLIVYFLDAEPTTMLISTSQAPAIPYGWYMVTICVSLRDLDLDSISRLTFRFERVESSKRITPLPSRSTDFVGEAMQQLKECKYDEFVRLRFHNEVPLDENGYLNVVIEAETEIETGFLLHYLEISPRQYQNESEQDYKTVYGIAAPSQIVTITQPLQSATSSMETRHIHAFEISDSGTYLATISLAKGQAFLELWDIAPLSQVAPAPMRVQGQQTLSSTSTSASTAAMPEPEQITVPFARTSFSISSLLTESFQNIGDTTMLISYSGSKVVLLSQQNNEDYSIPLTLFQCPLRSPKDRDGVDISEPWPLERVTPICEDRNELQNAFGMGYFHISDTKKLDPKTERFVFSDGLSVSVYNTGSRDRWFLMYRIPLSFEAHLPNAYSLIASLQGRFMIWSGYKGIASVWEIETGKVVSHIAIKEDDGDVFSRLSVDGSMVLVASKGIVSLYQTLTGVKLGVYKEGLSLGDYPWIRFNQNYFAVLNTTESGLENVVRYNSLVSTEDMSIKKNIIVPEAYWEFQKGFSYDLAAGYCQGTVVNIKRFKDDFILPATTKLCGKDCPMESCRLRSFFEKVATEVESASGEKFNLNGETVMAQGFRWLTIKISTIVTSDAQSSADSKSTTRFRRTITIPIGPAAMPYQYLFHAPSSRLIIKTGVYIQVWRLSSKDHKIGTLVSIRKFIHDKDRDGFFCVSLLENATICAHGEHFSAQFQILRWIDKVTFSVNYPLPLDPSLVHIVLSKEEEHDVIGTSYTRRSRIELESQNLVLLYLAGDVSCRSAVVEFLKPLIRPVLKNQTSCIVDLVNLWTPATREFFELIFVELLRLDTITWVPDTTSAPDQDPVCIILAKAQTHPSARETTQRIIHYCVTHAIQSRNLAFLTPVFSNMKTIMELYPRFAMRHLARVAYLPVPQRDYVLDHHIIIHAPTLRFWRKNETALKKLEDPIMRLQFPNSKNGPDSTKDAFTRGVFMASFNALWHYTSNIPPAVGGATRGSTFLRASSKQDSIVGYEEVATTSALESSANTITSLKTLLYMAISMIQLQKPAYVKCHDFSQEYFDNPAIAALVTYKWNTIGFHYWMIRFIAQCLFYALVVIAALMQVYYPEPARLAGLFIAIIVLALCFLWLEFLQAFRNWDRYEGSLYNRLDLVAFCLPLVASFIQLYNIYSPLVEKGNTQTISFSVLAVSLHLLFELRINENVCKFVTIIRQAIVEMRVFFVIFACGIFAFAIATVHLVHGCANENGCNRDRTDFPFNFFYALAGTYFFMNGNYNPVDKEFGSEFPNWGLQIMMIIFVFFTVILMMNVLIALVNVAFGKGGDSWRLVWIESRLQHIELAENLSYYLPGFRESYSIFPDVIYYTATDQQVSDYQEKYLRPLTKDFEMRRTCQTDQRFFKGWVRDAGGDDDFEEDEQRKKKKDEDILEDEEKEEEAVQGTEDERKLDTLESQVRELKEQQAESLLQLLAIKELLSRQ
ncbi:hypothetical protein BGZ83_007215 [Gryganskiella cystojenkinii]|nr:hypothetical protein BGZ83_007215 [Gryganskiella cystojenkinii]